MARVPARARQLRPRGRLRLALQHSTHRPASQVRGARSLYLSHKLAQAFIRDRWGEGLKSVPLMDEEILESLKTRTYEPGRLGSEAVPSEIKSVLRVEAR